MSIQKTEPSLRLISQIARDLVKMANDAEGLDVWLERHDHVRLFANSLYGDSDEADILGCMMALNCDRLS